MNSSGSKDDEAPEIEDGSFQMAPKDGMHTGEEAVDIR